MSLIKKIKDYYKERKSLLFTTPSHSQGNFISPEAKAILGQKYFKADFSEIEGFDNLRCPKSSIKGVLDKISQIYDSKASFMLINGSSSGIIASMLSILREGDKVLIARNCHISVYNALVLTGAKPVWFYPKFNKEWGIYKGVEASDIEEKIKHDTDIKALVITSPTYEGIYSDVQAISNICKKHNVKLIVDEAHGALLNFGAFNSKPAIKSGADVSIQSLHKTAGAINPAALLHISKTSDIEPQTLQNSLNLINTSSPSYPLMADIEATVDFLSSKSGKKHIEKLLEDIEIFKKSLPDTVKIFSQNNDPTKILLQFLNNNAQDIAEILNNKYKIEEEYSTEKALLFITGIGTDSKKLSKLSAAINKISKELLTSSQNISGLNTAYDLPVKIKYTPRKAYQTTKVSIKKSQACDKVCGEIIMKYPPGVPLLLPGELITQEHIKYIDKNEIKII